MVKNLLQQQRVAVFVDVQNLYHSAGNNNRVNYDKLLTSAVNNRALARAMAYVVSRSDINQNNFFNALMKFGYDLRYKQSKFNEKQVPVKTSCEVDLTLDVIQILDKVDVIVLITGDSAYLPLLKFIKHSGCKVEIMAFPSGSSNLLNAEADSYVVISEEYLTESKKAVQNVSDECINIFDEIQPETNANARRIM